MTNPHYLRFQTEPFHRAKTHLYCCVDVPEQQRAYWRTRSPIEFCTYLVTNQLHYDLRDHE